jgi:hypothetical protein
VGRPESLLLLRILIVLLYVIAVLLEQIDTVQNDVSTLELVHVELLLGLLPVRAPLLRDADIIATREPAADRGKPRGNSCLKNDFVFCGLDISPGAPLANIGVSCWALADFKACSHAAYLPS